MVRSLGKEGIVYGPDVPFNVWLADPLADLEFAWVHQAPLPWAERLLRG